jgi:hypothetical protein
MTAAAIGADAEQKRGPGSVCLEQRRQLRHSDACAPQTINIDFDGEFHRLLFPQSFSDPCMFSLMSCAPLLVAPVLLARTRFRMHAMNNRAPERKKVA